MPKTFYDKPVRLDDHIMLTIDGINHNGQGVGRVDGFAVFVPYAIPGEKVEVRIVDVRQSFARGEVLKHITPSPNRITPPCPVFYRCGGCQIQHIEYPYQLALKRQTVKDNLERIGKIFDVPIHPTIGMKDPWEYRNKAQFPFGWDKGKITAGFFAQGTHEIIDIPHCPIQHPINDYIMQVVRKLAEQYRIPIYNEKNGKGLLRHLVTRVAVSTGEAMCVFVINGRELPYAEKIITKIREFVPQVASIILNTNTRLTNVILGEENTVLWGKETITDYLGDTHFEISARSFYQVNPIQTKVLYQKALEYANLTGQETVYDLYCGIGTISLFLARKAKKVVGIEIVPEAVEDAKANAARNGLDNVEFIRGKAEEVVPALYQKGERADIVVVDPPRKGCDEALLSTMVEMAPKRVVYVSCNPSTLARDLGYLSQHGYRVEEVQPVDMFPQTAHVETVVKLERIIG